MSTKDKWEQVAHFLGLGVGLGFLLGPLAVPLYLIRELSPWKWIPWPFKGQWPPGKPFQGVLETLTQLDRVNDTRWDLIWTFAGYIVGQAAREIWLMTRVWG